MSFKDIDLEDEEKLEELLEQVEYFDFSNEDEVDALYEKVSAEINKVKITDYN